MDPQIDKILFTSDLSENSRHAFQYAALMAGRFNAVLHFLYVMEDVPMSAKAFLDAEKIQKIRAHSKQKAQRQLIGKRNDIRMLESELSRFCESTLKKNTGKEDGEPVNAQVRIEEGNVIETIIRVSHELDCRMIVMGSGTKGRLSRAMLGSVVKEVLDKSDRLVLVAPPVSDPRRY